MNSEKFGIIIRIEVRPGCEAQFWSKTSLVIDQIVAEEACVDYFALENETDSKKFIFYETWTGTKQDLVHAQTERPYRHEYEEALLPLLARPREIQFNWRLLRSAVNRADIDEETRGREKFGLFAYFQTKPGCQEEFRNNLYQVLDAMSKEPTFINFFLLQDEGDPTKFAIYETWIDRDNFLNVQMKRPYRQHYEEELPRLLVKPRETQTDWHLLRSVQKVSASSNTSS